MSFYNKYLKYINKYDELKKQVGGNNIGKIVFIYSTQTFDTIVTDSCDHYLLNKLQPIYVKDENKLWDYLDTLMFNLFSKHIFNYEDISVIEKFDKTFPNIYPNFSHFMIKEYFKLFIPGTGLHLSKQYLNEDTIDSFTEKIKYFIKNTIGSRLPMIAKRVTYKLINDVLRNNDSSITKITDPILFPDERKFYSVPIDLLAHKINNFKIPSNKIYIIFAPGDSPSKAVAYMKLIDEYFLLFDRLNIVIIDFPLSGATLWSTEIVKQYINDLIHDYVKNYDPEYVFFGLIDTTVFGSTPTKINEALGELSYPNLIKNGKTHHDFLRYNIPAENIYDGAERNDTPCRCQPNYNEENYLLQSITDEKNSDYNRQLYNCNVYIYFWYITRQIQKTMGFVI